MMTEDMERNATIAEHGMFYCKVSPEIIDRITNRLMPDKRFRPANCKIKSIIFRGIVFAEANIEGIEEL